MEKFDLLINKYSKKIIKFKYESIKLFWEFSDFKNIVNINNFITMLKKELNVEYNKIQENDIEIKILQLRKIILVYLNEINNLNITENKINNLDNFLSLIYYNVKNFINNTMIVYLFFEKLHEPILEKNNFFDNDLFYEWKYEEFKLKILKQNLILIKSLDKNENKLKDLIFEKEKIIKITKLKISECIIKAII